MGLSLTYTVTMRIEALTGYSSLEPPVGSSGVTLRLCDLAHLSDRWRLQGEITKVIGVRSPSTVRTVLDVVMFVKKITRH